MLIDSESVWNAVREDVALRHGGRWPAEAQRVMMGMSSTEWSTYMHEELGVAMSPPEISDVVVAGLIERYKDHLPLIDGAGGAVIELARDWPLALASSANPPLIQLALDFAGLTACFKAVVSSEQVPRGKPAPDVYLEAARRLGAPADGCAAVEDSSNGIRSAAEAGMTVFAIPNREFPPDDDALALATDVLDSIAELTPDRVRRAGGEWVTSRPCPPR